MYNNESSPVVVIKSEALKKVFDSPQNLKDKAVAVEKARKDLKKTGLRI